MSGSRINMAIIGFVLLFGLISCFNPRLKEMQKTMSHNQILSGQLVKKEFVNKGGKSTGVFEYYLRASIQDYFIKFCESEVSKADIDALKIDEFDTFQVEAVIMDGNWDICPDDPAEMQSRIGKYIKIIRIIY